MSRASATHGRAPVATAPVAGRGVAAPMLDKLRHLPRDGRDTLFQITVIGWTIRPH